ncbi:MAG: SprT-like domain-containing protein [Myxococcales bacterium]|nr:SprT-like domain-containing protein [Myxococcales bacterium]
MARDVLRDLINEVAAARARAQAHGIWLDQLRHAWRDINDRLLGGKLRPPVLQIDQTTTRIGHWERATRTLGIAEEHIWEAPWQQVLATLRHEVAHQYVDEVWGGDTRPHGEKFARACALLEISAAATVAPKDGPRSAADRVLARVRKLLALAGSGNRHEAANAMAAANTLLLRFNLERPESDPQSHRYGQRILGASAAAVPLPWKIVASILCEFFFVECIWVTTFNARKLRQESVLETLGAPENLEMAEFVHEFLHAAIERLWLAEAGALQRARNRRSLRREFQVGVLLGFSDKLRAERTRNEEKGLVWVGDADLDRFFKKRHPHVTSMRSAGVRRSSAHEAGRAAGERLTIHRPVSSRGPGGKALGPGRS